MIQPTSASVEPSDCAILKSDGPMTVICSARRNTPSKSGGNRPAGRYWSWCWGAATARSASAMAEAVAHHGAEQQRQIQHRKSIHQAFALLGTGCGNPERARKKERVEHECDEQV